MRDKDEFLHYNTWPAIVVCVSLFFFFGCSIVLLSSHDDKPDFPRFQYDFFSALSGNEEGMRYGYTAAGTYAQTLRAISPDNFDEEWRKIQLLLFAKEHNTLDQVATKFVTENPFQLDRIRSYTNILENGFMLDMLKDTRMKMTIHTVISGGKPPTITGMDNPFDWSKLTKIFIPWMLITQFVMFGAYCLFACTESPSYSYDRYPSRNPLFDLPPGIAYKLALVPSLPGSLPLMALILVVTGIKRAARNVKQRNERTYRVAGRKVEMPASDSRAKLGALAQRLGKG